MAFNNVFDSSLVDYSKDNEQQDNKYYNDNIVDIVANQIKSGKNIPHTFYFDNFKVHSKVQEYSYANNNYVLYDKETKICYATEIVEYDDDLYDWMKGEIYANHLDLGSIDGNIGGISIFIVKIPALNNRNFVFFSPPWAGYDIDMYEKSNSLDDFKNHIKDDNTIEFVEKYIKNKYNVLNLKNNRFKLVTMEIMISSDSGEVLE